MEKKIFGLTEEEIKKQSGKATKLPKSSPIRPEDEFLEPCIRGAEKILNDPEKKEMFYRIYRGL